MKIEVTKQKIQEVVQTIAKEHNPEKIILFGSWAWGEPREDSDVDLLIVKESSARRIERERFVQRTLFGTRMPIDTLVYTPEEVAKLLLAEDFFMKRIIAKGKVLYMRT